MSKWLLVPYRVQDLYIKYAAEMRQLMQDFPDHEDAWVIDTPEVGVIKAAASDAPFAPAMSLSRAVQQPFGGPNPLTSALLYGTLGAGLGWGSGKLLHMLFPERTKKDVSWRLGLPLGAMIGAGGAMGLHGYPNVKEHGWSGLTQPSPIQAEKISSVLERTQHQLRTYFSPDDDFKAASVMMPMFTNDIDVPYWLDTVRNDHTMPEPIKAVAGGVVAGAGAAKGSRWVTPFDVARVAVNAGLGAAFGSGIGLIAGPVLRLTPAARTDIQRAGFLTGAVKALMA